MAAYPHTWGKLTLTGDVCAADWEAWFEESYADYTRPAVALKDMARQRLGREPVRCESLGHVFRSLCPQAEDGTCREDDVIGYYAGEEFSRYCAMEVSEEGTLTSLISGVLADNWEGEPHQALIRAVMGTCGPRPHILLHGWGDGAHLLGMMSECPGACYYPVEVYSPIRAFLLHHIQRCVQGARIYPGWIYPRGVFTLTGPEGEALKDRTVDAIHSCEVLEHLVAPERAVMGFSKMLRPGGYLMLSTFFNSMDGPDPQHLAQNDKYQDSEMWFKVVAGCGLRPYWWDPRGVLKIWQKQ